MPLACEKDFSFAWIRVVVNTCALYNTCATRSLVSHRCGIHEASVTFTPPPQAPTHTQAESSSVLRATPPLRRFDTLLSLGGSESADRRPAARWGGEQPAPRVSKLPQCDARVTREGATESVEEWAMRYPTQAKVAREGMK
jgi:hypothetical protein